ncbi:hypothetical protein LAZ67_2003055 [Cordylochernes scorpioides]|uniref:CCHC-type domain-containing protein n=1 Tax=Cordylochernes scorpioides TaxID=51811 RepID=A0ABY6K3C2_9ARAC|nr:hypothetical protein LAZ67_2003055 [Cordylochernes scorpioides]
MMLEDEENDDKVLEEEKDTVIRYDEKWINLEIKKNHFLNSLIKNTDALHDASSEKGSLPGTRVCRLPKLELKIYDGSSLEWLGWWAQFNKIHEDTYISAVDKFQYLVQSMKENTRASRLVKSYPITADNYPKVIAALKDRFGDRVVLTEVYVRQLLGLVVNNARRKTIRIEDLYDRLESYLRSLESLGITIEQNAAFLYPLVESSLPEELITVWQRSALSGYNDEGEDTPQPDGRLSLLLKFLRREVKGEERLAYVRAGFGESSNFKSTRPNTTRLHVAEVNKPRERNLMACLFCRGDHWLRNCQKWLAMSVQKRREVLMKHRACFKCFRVGHHGRQCWRYVECNICKKSHNTLLHLGEQLVSNQGPSSSKENIHTRTDSNAEKPDVSFAGMHVRTAVPTALLATALVRLVNHLNEEKVVRALLDQGSQSSFIHRDVLQGLSIPVSKVDAQIYGINATKGEEVEDLAHFVIRPLVNQDWDLRLPLTEKLRDIQLADPQFMKSGKIDIILGVDVYGLLLLPEILRDDKTQLCAQNTKLGWIISGGLSGGDIGNTQVFTTRVQVRPSDAERQRIIWRRRSEDKLMAYRLNTVTYGTAAAPFLAMRTLLKLVEDEGAKYPRASRAIIKDTYVDDIITGADDLSDGIALRDELIELLRCGGFILKKWSSNDLTILGNIAKEHCAQKITFEQSKVIRTLGLGWIQNDPMDESLIETWNNFRKELNFIGSLRIPRWLGLGRNTQGVQLHGFGDASEDAYAAAVYIRIPTDDALLLTRLMKYIMEELNIKMESATCWSDSTIILSWIRTMSRNLPTFIGNRVAEIQSCPQIREWRYVPTRDNPADIASRGILGSELKQSSIWWRGPTWLSAESTEWPRMLPVFENQGQIELLSFHTLSETPFLVAIGEILYWMLRAKDQVKRCIRECLRSCFYLAQKQLKEPAAVLPNEGTEWKFNPPGAPHFGGLWEAGVKALKYHMRRIIGNNLLTYEELLTVLVQIEYCLNSRPLYPMSNDHNDQGVLTPAHFFLTEPSSCVPENDLLLVKNHLLTRWQLVQRVLQHLWKRWSRDYLNNLQQRNKWKTISPNVDINTLVLIKEERMPPAKWLMGIVVETHPGKDGLVRVVSVRTSVGVLRRPLVKLVLLPVAPPELDVAHQLGEEC